MRVNPLKKIGSQASALFLNKWFLSLFVAIVMLSAFVLAMGALLGMVFTVILLFKTAGSWLFSVLLVLGVPFYIWSVRELSE